MDAIAQITKPSLGGRAKVLLDGLPVGRGVGLSGDRDPVSLGRLEEGDVDVRVLLDLLVLVARVVVDEDGLELVSRSRSHGSRVLQRDGEIMSASGVKRCTPGSSSTNQRSVNPDRGQAAGSDLFHDGLDLGDTVLQRRGLVLGLFRVSK